MRGRGGGRRGAGFGDIRRHARSVDAPTDPAQTVEVEVVVDDGTTLVVADNGGTQVVVK